MIYKKNDMRQERIVCRIFWCGLCKRMDTPQKDARVALVFLVKNGDFQGKELFFARLLQLGLLFSFSETGSSHYFTMAFPNLGEHFTQDK